MYKETLKINEKSIGEISWFTNYFYFSQTSLYTSGWDFPNLALSSAKCNMLL